MKNSWKTAKFEDENLVSIEMHKSHILINKPIVVGMCILDISKDLMYKLLYNYSKAKYMDKMFKCYTQIRTSLYSK